MVATLKAQTARCWVCTIPLDAPGTCATCLARGARTVDCGCGFLYTDEQCGGHEDVCIQCGGPDPDEHGACASCSQPRYRWAPACASCHQEVASSHELSEAGTCTRCWVAAMATACTQADHDHAVANAWDSLKNQRPWPGTGLEIAECRRCNSTLARATGEDDFLRNADAVDEVFEATRAAVDGWQLAAEVAS